MRVTLTGENSFGLGQALRGLINRFISENGGLAVERLDGQEADFSQISEALTSLPFLASRKLVVLTQPGANKQFAEESEQILKQVAETTDIILVEPKLDKRFNYYKILKSGTDFKEFNELDTNDLSKWLTDEAKARGGSLQAADARYLVERIGASQQLLSNELEKLLLYDTEISRQTINLLTEPAPQSTVFELLEAAFRGQPKRALELYAEQRALKVEPPQIIAMLAWQLQVLAVIKTAGDRTADQIAKQAKINPFVIRKSQSIAAKITLNELKNWIHDILQIDITAKTSAVDTDEALQHYLIKLAIAD